MVDSLQEQQTTATFPFLLLYSQCRNTFNDSQWRRRGGKKKTMVNPLGFELVSNLRINEQVPQLSADDTNASLGSSPIGRAYEGNNNRKEQGTLLTTGGIYREEQTTER